MKTSKQFFIILLFALPVFFFQSTGCEKEYSFEGIDTATVIHDSIASPPVAMQQQTFPLCALCHYSDQVDLGTWDFKTGNSYLCGSFTNSGFIGGDSKTDFTFFGPSACSVDTGIVVSVYLAVPLNQDRFNLTTNEAAFYYYDNNAPQDIFITQPTSAFTVKVESFIYATGVATGTFSGTVFKANGDTAFITEGRFKAKL